MIKMLYTFTIKVFNNKKSSKYIMKDKQVLFTNTHKIKEHQMQNTC